MPRKKKIKTTNNNITEFAYCGVWKCPHTQCIRHHIYEPWDVQVLEKKFNPDKDWNCKDMLEE